MKIILNIIFVFFISSILFILSISFDLWLQYNFINEHSYKLYWEWIEWVTVIGWLPYLLSGFIAGICVALIVFGEKPQVWSIIAGFIMMVGGYYFCGRHWAIKPTIMRIIISNIWAIMYIIGAYSGGKLVLIIRIQLDKNSREAERELSVSDR